MLPDLEGSPCKPRSLVTQLAQVDVSAANRKTFIAGGKNQSEKRNRQSPSQTRTHRQVNPQIPLRIRARTEVIIRLHFISLPTRPFPNLGGNLQSLEINSTSTLKPFPQEISKRSRTNSSRRALPLNSSNMQTHCSKSCSSAVFCNPEAAISMTAHLFARGPL